MISKHAARSPVPELTKVYYRIVIALVRLCGNGASESSLVDLFARLSPLIVSTHLRCYFQRGDNPIVHWIKDNEGTPFLSYYNANPQFRNVKGRGFLFSDQVSKGNASLRLSWVQLHDQGRYTCYVTTRKNERYTYVNVNVQAAPVLDSSEGISREREPVRSTEPTTASRTLNAAITPRWSTQPFPNKGGYHGPTTENVDADRDRTAATPERDDGATKEAEAAPVLEVRMEEVDDTVVCCSKGIYPKPELTWSTEPPSGGALNATTAVWRTSLLLYDIRSSLLLSHEDAVMVYSCVVTSGKHSKKATLMVEGVRSKWFICLVSFFLHLLLDFRLCTNARGVTILNLFSLSRLISFRFPQADSEKF
uniref:CD276 antigen-like n=1 Tax=Oryzias latipes TaxID=8090 RepID=A0A286P9R7_ORYLA|nr:CD276 antigen-like [Oryzias latipes]